MHRILGLLKIFRREAIVIILAMKHPDTPRNVKGMLLLALLYFFSPIDLVPDAIPLAGALDDFVLVPTAIGAALKMLPVHVRTRCENDAQQALRYLPAIAICGTVLVGLWIFLLVYGLYRLIF